MHISVGDKNLESLFSGKQHVQVPGFQRSYAWTIDQVNEYWTDLRESAIKGESHFWGPIVLLQDSKDESELKLIDGQQRITTSMITLALLRDAAYGLTNRTVREGTLGAQDVLLPVRNFLFRPPMFTTPKFKASYLIDAVFKSHILADPESFDKKPRPELTVRGKGLKPAEKLATRELRKAYLRIRELLTKFLNEVPDENSERANRVLELFTALTSGFEIHSMVLTSEDDAYILFETLNDRGLQLNPSDLLKTLTLREIRQNKAPDALENALAKWDRMVENLGEYDFSKFLRHYLLTQSNKPVQAKKIFTYFKETIDAQGIDGAERNLVRLASASESYAKLLGISEIGDAELDESVLRMNSFSDTHRVFLLAVLEAGLPLEVVRQLFRATEALAARWILLGENAQELEGHYQTQSRALAAAPTAETAHKIVEFMITKSPTDSDLALLYRSEKADLQKYFLRRLEGVFGGATLSWDKPITIEHLAPQNPGADDYWTQKIFRLDEEPEEEFSYDEVIQQWGNLTLLERKLNSSIQNSHWPRKVAGDKSTKYDGLSASTMNINRVLSESPVWDRTKLEVRNKWLTKCSLALVSRTWVETGQVKLDKLVL